MTTSHSERDIRKTLILVEPLLPDDEEAPDTERVHVPEIVRPPVAASVHVPQTAHTPLASPDTEREPVTKRPWELGPPSVRYVSFDELFE